MSEDNTTNKDVIQIHYSNESISDENCIVTYTTSSDNQLSNACSGSWFRQRTRLIEFYGDISNMYISQFMFSQCYALKRLNISGTDKVTDGVFKGNWTIMNTLQHTFRGITGIKKQYIKLPNVTLANSNFYNTGIEEIDSDYRNIVRMISEYEECSNLKTIVFNGGFNNLIWGTSVFRNCSQLTSFEYDLPRLLSGIGMFQGCKLNKSSVERILYSLPNIANIKKATTSGDITEGVKVGNTIYPYWGKIKGIEVKHETDVSLKQPTNLQVNSDDETKTNRIIAKIANNVAGNCVSIYYRKARRKPIFNTNSSEIEWYWEITSIPKDDIGILDIGVAQGVKSQITDALNYAKTNGWIINIS